MIRTSNQIILNVIFIQIIILILSFNISNAQIQNFVAPDCDKVSHDLFSELDKGNVVVLVWVMPCASCIAPALSAYTEVINMQGIYPGKIQYFLVDDNANTTCATLKSWGENNGISTYTFSNKNIKMTNFGNAGMPKILILGGANHTKYFDQTSGLDVEKFKLALSEAINSSTVNGISEIQNNYSVNIFPNPVANNSVNFKYELNEKSSVSLDFYNVLGEKVKMVLNENQNVGKYEFTIDISKLSNGIYFAKYVVNNKSNSIKFIISK